MRPSRAFLRAAAPLLMAFVLTGCDGTLQRSQDSVASANARTAQLNNQPRVPILSPPRLWS